MRAFLLFLARQEGFKNFAMNFRFFRNTALRFVAGESLEDAIVAVRQARERAHHLLEIYLEGLNNLDLGTEMLTATTASTA